jgi:hypothetical protein
LAEELGSGWQSYWYVFLLFEALVDDGKRLGGVLFEKLKVVGLILCCG